MQSAKSQLWKVDRTKNLIFSKNKVGRCLCGVGWWWGDMALVASMHHLASCARDWVGQNGVSVGGARAKQGEDSLCVAWHRKWESRWGGCLQWWAAGFQSLGEGGRWQHWAAQQRVSEPNQGEDHVHMAAGSGHRVLKPERAEEGIYMRCMGNDY